MLEQPHITPDPMMDELSAIKDQIYEEIKELSPEQQIAWFHDQAQKAAELMGCEKAWDPSQPGVYRLIPKGQP